MSQPYLDTNENSASYNFKDICKFYSNIFIYSQLDIIEGPRRDKHYSTVGSVENSIMELTF